MDICMCGAQAGYPHRPNCPYPLFRGSDADIERWAREANALDADRLQGSTPTCVVCDDHGCEHCPAVTVTSGPLRPTLADIQYEQRAREEGWPHHEWWTR